MVTYMIIHRSVNCSKVIFSKLTIQDIKDGVLTATSTLRDVFVGAYSKAVERLSNKLNNSSYIEEKKQ
ncbi:hypothetical protein LSPCS325_14980 [Lysinibacillus sp. CTST325]